MRKVPTVILLLLTIFCIVLFACSESVKTGDAHLLVEKQIGNSEMYISLPGDYTIEETVGPDFTVCYFRPGDSTNKRIGSAGVYFGGHPNLFGPDTITCKNQSIDGMLLGRKTSWNVYDCDGKVSAETIVAFGEYDKVHAFATGKSLSETDSLIKLFATLRKK